MTRGRLICPVPGNAGGAGRRSLGQIEAVNAQAAARGSDIHITVDFAHIAQYVWDASWAVHGAGGPSAEIWVGRRLARIVNGRSADVADDLTAVAEDAGLTPILSRPCPRTPA